MWSPRVVFFMRFTVFTCGVHIWWSHVGFTCGLPHAMYCVHMWSPHMIFTCGVHMWFTSCDVLCSHVSPHVEFTYDLKYVPYVIYRMWFTVCGVHMWCPLKSHTDIKSYTVNHMWFSVYDFRMWSPYMISVCGVHIWFSSMIIRSVYDHIRKPHVELTSVCGVHMWDFPYVESTCGPFPPCDGVATSHYGFCHLLAGWVQSTYHMFHEHRIVQEFHTSDMLCCETMAGVV